MSDQKKSYHYGDLRRELIRTAMRIISQQGVQGLTMRGLSKEIGVSRMAAYRHFSSKVELLCAVAEEGFLTLFSVFADATSPARPRAFDTLEAVGRAYLDFAVSNPALYRLMFGHELTQEERTPALGQAAEGAFSFLVSTVELSQKQGLARPDSPMAMANLLWAMMHGLACLLIDGQLQTEDSEEGLPTLFTAKKIDLPANAGKIVDLMVEVLTVGLAPVPSP